VNIISEEKIAKFITIYLKNCFEIEEVVAILLVWNKC